MSTAKRSLNPLHLITSSRENWFNSNSGKYVLYGRTRSSKSSAIFSVGAKTIKENGSSDGVVVLAPTRLRAQKLREAFIIHAMDQAKAKAPVFSVPKVMTPNAFAYHLLSEHSGLRAKPSLVTGAEQDALIKEIITDLTQNEGFSLPQIPPEGLALAGFRQEVRELISRAIERGIDPDALAKMDDKRSDWQALSIVYRRYLDVLELWSKQSSNSGLKLDGPLMIQRALKIIEQMPRYTLVAVDDAQDFTKAGISLVQKLAENTQKLVITSTPQAAVEGFRGGLADAAWRISENLAVETSILPAPRLKFDRYLELLAQKMPNFQAPAELWHSEAKQNMASTSTDPEPGMGLTTYLAANANEQAKAIASTIRFLSAQKNVAHEKIAVVTRSARLSYDLADRLARLGIDVDVTLKAAALKDIPVVRDMLSIAQIGISIAELTEDKAITILKGPFGDCTDLQIKQIKRALSKLNFATLSEFLAFASSGEQELEKALEILNPVELRTLNPLLRIKNMIQAVDPNAPVEVLLYEIYQASALAKTWQEAALKFNTPAQRLTARMSNHRLDSILQLLSAAGRYQERTGGVDPRVFIEHIQALNVPEDAIFTGNMLGGRIEVTTPAHIAGKSFDTVIIAQMQEGVWPNLQLRTSLLGAGELALMADNPELEVNSQVLRAIMRKDTLADEISLVINAISRAENRVLITACEQEGESNPSAIFNLLATEGGWIDEIDLTASPMKYPDERELLAQIRRSAEAGEVAENELAEILQKLAQAGIEDADPAKWYHKELSSQDNWVKAGQEIVLSPSALSDADKCLREYIANRSVLESTTSSAQMIGNIIHELAEKFPTAGKNELLAQLDLLLDAPAEEEHWTKHAEYERVREMVDKLGTYLSSKPAPLAVEQKFAVNIGDVKLTGKVDRIEAEGEGLKIIDFKTSKTPLRPEEAETDLQLGAYQLGLSQLPLAESKPILGAELVYVGTNHKNIKNVGQSSIFETAGANENLAGKESAENPNWMVLKLKEISENLRNKEFEIKINQKCDYCRVKNSCPLYEEGRQL